MSCANKAYGYDKKHENHIALIEQMFIKDKMQNKILNAKNMEEAFNIIKQYPLIGDFMAYQLITDINYSEATNFSEREFTVAGPGSERGIKKAPIRGLFYFAETAAWGSRSSCAMARMQGIRASNTLRSPSALQHKKLTPTPQ